MVRRIYKGGKLRMITAIEAYRKSSMVLDGRLDEELEPVYKQIELACDQGEKEIFLDRPLKSTLANRLEILGYEVNTYPDPIHGWSRINWR